MPDFNALIESCNLQIPKGGDDKKVIALSHFITNEIASRSGIDLYNMEQKEMFYTLFICFISVSQLTANTELNWEALSFISCLEYFLPYNKKKENIELLTKMFRQVIALNNLIAMNKKPDNTDSLALYKNLSEPIKEMTKTIRLFIESKGHIEFRDELLNMAGELLKTTMKHI